MTLPIVLWILATMAEPIEDLILPRVIEDVCPFECCQYGPWVAMQETMAYKNKGDASEVAFVVRKGESVMTIGGEYLVRRAGKAILIEDHCEDDFADHGHEFLRGEEVALLAYLGEGAWQVWHRGVFLDLESFWARPELHLDLPGVELSWPQMEWWIHAKSGQGAEGWLRIKVLQPEDEKSAIRFDLDFDGMDGCD